MKSLFRNPFFKMIQNCWHWAAIWTALAWGLGGLDGLRYATYANAFVAGLISSILFVAFIKAQKGNAETEAAREKGKSRFLCPNCLHFGAFLHQCGSCQSIIEEFQVDTQGQFNPACVECQTVIFPGNIQASCDQCLRPSNPELHHHRSVEILVTLADKDFQELLKTSNAQSQRSLWNVDFFFCDENQTLKYVLNFGSSTQAEVLDEQTDALKWIDGLWLDLNQSDPLQVARQLDALIRNHNLAETERLRIKVFVRQEQIDSVLRLRLEQQFGEVRYGIAPEQLFLPAMIPALSVAAEDFIISPAVEPKATRLPKNQEVRS